MSNNTETETSKKRKGTNVEMEHGLPKKKSLNANRGCYHCGNKSTEDSYFTIPKGVTRIELRAEWLRFLELDEPVPPHSLICSKHFLEKDMSIRDKVPSIKIPKREPKQRKSGIYKCFYCEKRDGGNTTCYFTFPEDPNVFQKWIDFCECAEEYILPSTRLCSDHFERHLIIGEMGWGRKRKLLPHAVPTIKTLPTSSSASDGKEKRVADNQTRNTTASVERETHRSCTPISQSEIVPLDFCAVSMHHSTMSSSRSDETRIVTCDIENVRTSSSPEPEAQLPCTATTSRTAELVSDSSNTSQSITSTSTSDCQDIPKYLGQIKAAHLATPRNAKACFYKALSAINRKNKQIKALQMQVHRAMKKIQTLTDMVIQLKEENIMLSDES